MANGTTTSSLLRLVGVMAIGVGAAWALQVLGLGGSSAMGRMVWVLAAATVAGIDTSAALIAPDEAAKA